jgi:DNA-binding transcriptional LysR family regulator
MRKDHPEVEITVFESDMDEKLDQGMLQGELDLCFVVGERAEGFDTVHLLDDPFVVVARPGQFPDGPVAASELVDQPMIGQHACSYQLLMEAGLADLGVTSDYVFRSNDNGTVTAMVRAGLGLAVLPLLCVEPEDPRISIHRLDPAMPDRRIGLARRSGRPLSPVAERFIAISIEAGAAVAAHLEGAGLDRARPVGGEG